MPETNYNYFCVSFKLEIIRTNKFYTVQNYQNRKKINIAKIYHLHYHLLLNLFVSSLAVKDQRLLSDVNKQSIRKSSSRVFLII